MSKAEEEGATRPVDARAAVDVVIIGGGGGGVPLPLGVVETPVPRAASTVVHPYLRSRGVELVDNWSVLPPPGLPALASLPPASLPAGFAPAFRDAARKLPDQSFGKRQLVEALLRGQEDRIVRGAVTGFQGREPVEAVQIQLAGSRAAVEI